MERLLGFFFALVGFAGLAEGQLLLVASQGCAGFACANGTISVISGTTVIATLTPPSPSSPMGIAANPAGTMAAVSHFNLSGRIDFFNLTTNPPTLDGPPLVVPALPQTLAFSLEGACLLAGEFGSGAKLMSIHMGTRAVVSTVVLAAVSAVEVVPGGPLVLVTNPFAGNVQVLTLGPGCTLANTGTIVPAGTGFGAFAMTVSPNGKRALVGGVLGVGILGISGLSVSLLGTLPILNSGPIAFLPNGTRAYVGRFFFGPGINLGARILSVDSSDNITDTGTDLSVDVPGVTYYGQTKQIATDGIRLFLNRGGGNLVYFFDVATGAAGAPIIVGLEPRGMAIANPACGPHRVHGHFPGPGSAHFGSTHQHHGQHGHTAPNTGCPPHVPGHSAAPLLIEQ